MIFEPSDGLETYLNQISSRLKGLNDADLLVFALSVCEHMRSLIEDLATVAPVLDEILETWWETAQSQRQVQQFDDAPIEEEVAVHIERNTVKDLVSFGLQLNGGLGFCLSLVKQWNESSDDADLVRLASAAVSELADFSSAEAAEVTHLLVLIDSTESRSHLDPHQARERAMSHGTELARMARTQWEL